MTRTHAQRLRFGILAARHGLERWRLTPDQIDYLEGCEAVGWRIRDSRAAYRSERTAALARRAERRRH